MPNSINNFRRKRVFISSKCGREYTYVRRELQVLLESTGLFEVYNFDNEGSSAYDVQNQYLGQLAKSDIAVFLIWNKHGVTDAVYSEHRKAAECDLKRHYIFCDIPAAKVTTLQKEVEKSVKYAVVHEFTRIAEEAYHSVIQDIIDFYCQKSSDGNISDVSVTTPLSNTSGSLSVNLMDIRNMALHEESAADDASAKLGANVNTSGDSKNEDPRSGGYGREDTTEWDKTKGTFFLLDKSLSSAPKELKQYVWNLLVGENTHVAEQEDGLLTILRSFLNTVLCLEDFKESSFDKLSSYVVENQSRKLKDVLIHRLNAIKAFYKSDIDTAVAEEREALAAALKDVKVSWIINDIAIDLRNLVITQEREKRGVLSSFTAGQEGQSILDESEETVHFPILDRKVADGNERIIERYEKDFSTSPYTITYGDSLPSIADDFVDAFWVGLMYGSFTHTYMITKYLVDVLKMVVNIYDDHIPAVQLLRFACINGNQLKDNLNYVERTYHSDSELLSPEECRSALESIKRIPLAERRLSVEYYFLAKFSLYLGDDDFEDMCREILPVTISWAGDPKREYNLTENIMLFYTEISVREKVDECLDFGIELLKSTNGIAYKRQLYQNFRNINYDKADYKKLLDFTKLVLKDLDKVSYSKEVLEMKGADIGSADNSTNNGKSTGKDPFKENPYLRDLLIRIELSNKEAGDFIGLVIRDQAPDYYEDVYLIEMDLMKAKNGEDIDIFHYIQKFLAEAEFDNERTKKGTIFGGYNPYETILNIIRNNHPHLTREQVTEIIDTAVNVLENKAQIISHKVTACEIVSLISRLYGNRFSKVEQKKLYSKLKDRRADNRKAYAGGIDKDSIIELDYAYSLMLLTFSSQDTSKIQEQLFSVRQDQSYVLIRLLSITREYLIADNIRAGAEKDDDTADTECENTQSQSLSEILQMAFLQFTLVTSQSIEKDVQVQSVLVLVELTRYTKTFGTAINRLSLFMNSGNAFMRMVTISRVNEIAQRDKSKSNNAYVLAIRQKAKTDHNYMVRKIAERG